MHDMHDMAWTHWIGVALALPAALVVFRASWRSYREQRAIDGHVTPLLDKENT
jgi:hypothetical protein